MSFVSKFCTVSGLTIVSRIFGVIRESMFSHFLGACSEMDAFLIAFKFPSFLENISLKAVSIQFLYHILWILQRVINLKAHCIFIRNLYFIVLVNPYIIYFISNRIIKHSIPYISRIIVSSTERNIFFISSYIYLSPGTYYIFFRVELCIHNGLFPAMAYCFNLNQFIRPEQKI